MLNRHNWKLAWRRAHKANTLDKKRKLFAELSEGFDALKREREGKITLRKHPIAAKPALQVTAADLVALRE
jgi:putative transcriptional regulator